MAGSFAPEYTICPPKLVTARLSTATGATEVGAGTPTNAVALLASGAGTTSNTRGSKLRRVKVMSIDTTAVAAGFIRIFYYDGTNYHPLIEIPVTAMSGAPSASQAVYDSGWYDLDVDLPASKTVYATTTQSKQFCVLAEVGDYATS
jgi:hypothetical protein